MIIYNETELEGGNHRRWTLDRMWDVQFPADIPTIFTGDWNAHHRTWQTNQDVGAIELWSGARHGIGSGERARSVDVPFA